MRERMAKAYAVGLFVLMTGLAAFFADRQNVPRAASTVGATASTTEPQVPPPSEPPDQEEVARGRTVLEEQGCVRCHRIEGEGNPRSVLDGVGARLPPERIRAFIVADDAVRASLSPSVARTKAGYADLPESDLSAMVTFLTTLR